ncbi:restriction endonuclease [Streptomyces kanasensis]|uniref:restriction endonuclease n=1 Tax=Streptomyces kanasensis TaxID=936756 RepID=UPI001E44C13A|nr:restriction endonuclease [Streptomyces kanasensis]
MIRDGCAEVERVGGAGDQGADVIATDPFGRRWIIQCKHRRQGVSGAPVGVRDLHVLNGTGRPVHRGDVVVLVTNAAFTKPARRFGQDQRLHLIDRVLLEEWMQRGQPVWELLDDRPPTLKDPAPDVSPGAADSPEPKRYTLASAYEAQVLPWKPATMRQYFVRSVRRGVPVPAGKWDGQATHYTEEELRTWLADWASQAGSTSKIHSILSASNGTEPVDASMNSDEPPGDTVVSHAREKPRRSG